MDDQPTRLAVVNAIAVSLQGLGGVAAEVDAIRARVRSETVTRADVDRLGELIGTVVLHTQNALHMGSAYLEAQDLQVRLAERRPGSGGQGAVPDRRRRRVLRIERGLALLRRLLVGREPSR